MLRLATEVLRQEGLLRKTFTVDEPVNCGDLQRRWKEWTSEQLLTKRGENYHRLSGAFKGSKTLFDEPCRVCDKVLATEAIKTWAVRACGAEQRTAPHVIIDIKRRARRILGRRWWKGEREGTYVPDQQGCFEMERGCGGTLSVVPPGGTVNLSELTVCQAASLVWEEDGTTGCRIGAAKSKGKLRVVTMQGATMKRELRPVHEQAYNRLSRYDWLVRGDVKPDHFLSLGPLAPGQLYTSGDYEASTDNLNKDAVLAVVEVMAESLPSEKAKLLVSSFRDCWVQTEEGRKDVVRGSMMGNLGSFVVLCILNRICFERARDLVGLDRTLPCLLNGDDILFKGCDGMYHAWLFSTAEVGFVINRSKTMRSKEFGDLNSQTFHYGKGRLVKKLCFGFLGSDSWKQPIDTLATPLFDLCRQVKFSTSAWLLNSRPVRSLLRRAPLPLQSIPHRWWNFLVKKRWFRGLLDADPCPVDSIGVERKLPYVYGPPIYSSPAIEKEISEANEVVIRTCVNEWIGVPVHPLETKRVAVADAKLRSRYRVTRSVVGWHRLWLAPVLESFTRFFAHLLVPEGEVWVDDQPGLETYYRLNRRPRQALSFCPPQCLLGEVIPELHDEGVVFRCV